MENVKLKCIASNTFLGHLNKNAINRFENEAEIIGKMDRKVQHLNSHNNALPRKVCQQK